MYCYICLGLLKKTHCFVMNKNHQHTCMSICHVQHCAVPQNTHTPTPRKVNGNTKWVGGGWLRQWAVKTQKKPSIREVWKHSALVDCFEDSLRFKKKAQSIMPASMLLLCFKLITQPLEKNIISFLTINFFFWSSYTVYAFQ